MIKVNCLTKIIGNKTILRDINLDVKKGEIFGFLGPNMAGKTTTMKILAGVSAPTSGEIFILGHKMPDERTKIIPRLAFIPDQPLLYEKLTGREYLNFIYSIFKLSENNRDTEIDYMLEKFDLYEQADELIENYSQGMKQKLSFAAAFIRKPEILLIDEPMTGLDPKSNKMIQDMLIKFANNGGVVFLSTHMLDIAENICNKITVIDKGRTIAHGTINELRNIMKIDSGKLIDIFLAVTEKNETIP